MICGHHGVREARACKNDCGRCIPCCATLCVPATGPRPKREGPPPVPAVPTNRGRYPRAIAECGTRPGYRAHRRNGEDACDDCKEANARYNLDYTRRKAS